MTKTDHRIKIALLLIGDFLVLYVALFSALYIRYVPHSGEEWVLVDQHVRPFFGVFTIWLLFFGAFGLYDIRFTKNSRYFVYRLLSAMGINIVAAIVIFYFLPILKLEPRRNLLLIAAAGTSFLLLWRSAMNLLFIRTPASRIIFFGGGKEAVQLADYLLHNPQLGQKPVAWISLEGEEEGLARSLGLPFFNTPRDLPHIAQDFSADAIVVSREIKENKTFVSLFFQMIPLGIAVTEFSRLYEATTGKIPLSLVEEVWFLENLVGIKKHFYEFFKRFTDILFSLLFGILTLLFLPFIAAAIRLDSRGPVFFLQKRTGRGGKTFRLIKFRSMVENAEEIGGAFKGNGNGRDPRLTRVGSLLRKSYLDELPQVWNILKGEMSFVGPRPERPEFIKELAERIPFYKMRLLVPPGLTGWAQINMENDASVEDAEEKMQYDLSYIKNRSFILDLLIILRTVSSLLRRQGR
jgi:exopolysaccharide biosynthesis polyprenyl glycosylphosphotransferase